MPPIIDDPGALLGATACWTASVRALKSHRQDCLFEDPWAESLAGQIGAEVSSGVLAEWWSPD